MGLFTLWHTEVLVDLIITSKYNHDHFIVIICEIKPNDSFNDYFKRKNKT